MWKEFSIPKVFNEFEVRLICSLAESLDVVKRKIFLDQISRFNKVHRDPYDHGVKSIEVYMYWKRWFKVRRDFPLKFESPAVDFRLASAEVLDDGNLILVDYLLMNGAMFSIKLTSQREVFYPKSDNYTIGNVHIYL